MQLMQLLKNHISWLSQKGRGKKVGVLAANGMCLKMAKELDKSQSMCTYLIDPYLKEFFVAYLALESKPWLVIASWLVGSQSVVSVAWQGKALATVLTGVTASLVNVGDMLVQVGLGLERFLTFFASGSRQRSIFLNDYDLHLIK